MVAFRQWLKKPQSRVVVGVLAVVLAVVGVVLGLDLSTSDQAAPNPTTSPSGSDTPAGNDASSVGGASAQDAPSDGSSGGASAGSGGSGSGASTGGASSTTAAPQKVAVICTTARGNVSTTVTIASCSQLQATGGSGTFPGALLSRSGSGTIRWNGTGTTTFVYVVSHPASQRRKCPNGDTETTLRGSVTSNRPVGAGNVGIKGAVHAKLCIDSGLHVTLVPGHTFQL
jgi:hypothetical protein